MVRLATLGGTSGDTYLHTKKLEQRGACAYADVAVNSSAALDVGRDIYILLPFAITRQPIATSSANAALTAFLCF
jgi:hypothetical protein